MIDPKRARATAEAYVEALRTDDEKAWVSLFADDAWLRDPADSPALVGKAAIAGFWKRTHASGISDAQEGSHPPGMTMMPEVLRTVVCGDEVMLLFRLAMHGTDGSGVVLDTCDILTVREDGRIRSMKAYWDKGCLHSIKAAAAR